MNERKSSPEPDAEDLQQLLEEADRRKEKQRKKLGGPFTLIVCLPIVLLFAWAGVFLICYDTTSPPARQTAPAGPTVITPAAAAPLTPQQSEMARYDIFRDEKDRVVKTNVLGLKKTSDKLIDKDDIRFAMELLNFMHRPAKH